jgi:co-chaperonin GroES (HSP10)
MTTLILPDDVKAKKTADRLDPLQKAYVRVEDRVLDPTKLPQTYVDRLPTPAGYRILILPYQGRAVTKGGIVIPEENRERSRLATVAGYVIKMGEDCYADKAKFSKPWCKVGDWIIIGRYAGARFKIEDGDVRIINDDEVIATIADPEDITFI